MKTGYHELTKKILNNAHPRGDFKKVDSIIREYLGEKAEKIGKRYGFILKEPLTVYQILGLTSEEAKKPFFPYPPLVQGTPQTQEIGCNCNTNMHCYKHHNPNPENPYKYGAGSGTGTPTTHQVWPSY